MANLDRVITTAETEILAWALNSAGVYSGDAESLATDLNEVPDFDYVFDEETGLHYYA